MWTCERTSLRATPVNESTPWAPPARPRRLFYVIPVAAARAWFADAGYDSVYGARPLRRVIQRALRNRLAGLNLEGKIADGGTATVSAGKDGLVINGVKAEAA